MPTAEIFNKCIPILACAVPLLAGVGTAQAANHLKVESSVQQEIVFRNEAGRDVLKRVPAGKVVPGDEVIYTTRFTNRGDQPADDVVITNPIPAHTVYRSGSARGEHTRITFSVDGGGHFARPDALQVKDARGRIRPARPADYTDIRWTYQGGLPAGARQAVSFRAELQ